jgi:uncharacterized protein (TIGR02444 family)
MNETDITEATDSGAIDWPDNPFWDYSLTVYRKPGVAEDCLALQDRAGVDVNMLLMCFWVAEKGGGLLSDQAMAQLLAAAERWQQRIIVSLRLARKALGKDELGPAAQLRRKIAAAEIMAERIEQQALWGALERPAAPAEPLLPAAAARRNIESYARIAGLVFGPAEKKLRDRLIERVFGAP